VFAKCVRYRFAITTRYHLNQFCITLCHLHPIYRSHSFHALLSKPTVSARYKSRGTRVR
jgi:hypothetical protein